MMNERREARWEVADGRQTANFQNHFKIAIAVVSNSEVLKPYRYCASDRSTAMSSRATAQATAQATADCTADVAASVSSPANANASAASASASASTAAPDLSAVTSALTGCAQHLQVSLKRALGRVAQDMQRNVATMQTVNSMMENLLVNSIFISE